MNIYDPANYIVYVSMDRTFSASGPSAVSAATPSVAAASVPVEHRLPTGYANGSPLTRLRRSAPAGFATTAVARALGGSA